jgi:hypothetical protein
VWVPRNFVEYADYLSKIVDTNDFMLRRPIFLAMQQRWGIDFTVDCFATARNCLVDVDGQPRFFSRWWSPDSLGINAFRFSWFGLRCWINPPFTRLGEVLAHLWRSRSLAGIFVPDWRKQHWWVDYCPDGRHWAPFVLDAVEITTDRYTFLPGTGANEVNLLAPNFRLFALLIDFRFGDDACTSPLFRGYPRACVAKPGCCPTCD